jgi:hypothetical protein
MVVFTTIVFQFFSARTANVLCQRQRGFMSLYVRMAINSERHRHREGGADWTAIPTRFFVSFYCLFISFFFPDKGTSLPGALIIFVGLQAKTTFPI